MQLAVSATGRGEDQQAAVDQVRRAVEGGHVDEAVADRRCADQLGLQAVPGPQRLAHRFTAASGGERVQVTAEVPDVGDATRDRDRRVDDRVAQVRLPAWRTHGGAAARGRERVQEVIGRGDEHQAPGDRRGAGEVAGGHPAPQRLARRLATPAGRVGVQVAVEAGLVQHPVGDRGAAFAACVAAEVGGEHGAQPLDVTPGECLLGGVGVEVTGRMAELRPLARSAGRRPDACRPLGAGRRACGRHHGRRAQRRGECGDPGQGDQSRCQPHVSSPARTRLRHGQAGPRVQRLAKPRSQPLKCMPERHTRRGLVAGTPARLGWPRYLAGWAMVSITAVLARIRTSFSPGATSTP